MKAPAELLDPPSSAWWRPLLGLRSSDFYQKDAAVASPEKVAHRPRLRFLPDFRDPSAARRRPPSVAPRALHVGGSFGQTTDHAPRCQISRDKE